MLGRRWLMAGLLSVFALLSMSCISPCFLARTARNSTPQATSIPTVPPSESAAKSFEEKAKAFTDDTFRVEFTDEEVTSYLALQMADSLPVASPRIAFQPGSFAVEGDITSPIRGRLTITGTIEVSGGKPKVVFSNAKVAGMTVPQAMLGSVADSMSQMILDAATGVEIEQVELLAGRIVITGRNTNAP